MNFKYETQGAITYLVCELEPADQLDNLTLGMLTNNHINGLAPVLYTEMNGQRFLKYNISAKVAVHQFFGGNMNKHRALQAFESILNALCSADEYMIDQNCFSLNPDHVFLNVSNCEAALVCIPVAPEKNINEEAAALFKQLLVNTQFDPNEDSGYITQMISYLNSGSDFTVYGFRDLVWRIANSAAAPVRQAPQMQQQMPPQQSRPVAPPVSSFDSTISFDDMLASRGGNQQPPANQGAPFGNQPPAQPPFGNQPPAQPPFGNQPPAQPQPQIRKPVPVQPQPQIQKPVPPQRPAVMPGQPAPAPNANVQRPPVQNNAGSAVPGRNPYGFAVPGQGRPVAHTAPVTPVPQPQQPVSTPGAQGEKKISFLTLMMHYNKENAALYKAQREANKGKPKEKAVKPPKQTKEPQMQQMQGQQPGYPAQQGAPMNGMPGQPGVPAGYKPPMQPLPVQNSFNETTVLSAANGETTVLNETPAPSGPYLTRIKTGERIYINKPVFRIGKERSYVDCFIADNTAISRSHCNIHCDNGEYFIEDTNSTNHTYINGSIISSNVKVKLSNGDRVRLANEDFTFSI